jgi:hypothetical protein
MLEPAAGERSESVLVGSVRGSGSLRGTTAFDAILADLTDLVGITVSSIALVDLESNSLRSRRDKLRLYRGCWVSQTQGRES